MKQLNRLALFLPVVSLAACVNLTKPKAVEECANYQPYSNCTDRKDSGATKDTSTTPPDTTVVTPNPDSGVPDTQTADTKVPVGPDVAVDTIVTPKPDTQPGPETAVPDPKPEATVEPPLVVVEPSTPDASVRMDTNPPIDTRPDTLVPIDTTPPSPDTRTTGSENCPVVIVKSGGATVGQPGLGAYCVVTCDDLGTSYFGWGCSNFAGRTVKVNGVEITCGKTPVPAKVNGYYVFEISAGTNTSSSIFWYNQTNNATCPLPSGGLLP